MTTPVPSPLDALMAKLKAWSDEAQRLDALGQPYWQGEGSAHPPEWILASALRKRVEELQPIATSIAKERQAMEAELSEIRAAVTTSDLSHVEIVLIAQANAQDSEIVEALEQRADTSESARSAAEAKLEAETQARQEAETRWRPIETCPPGYTKDGGFHHVLFFGWSKAGSFSESVVVSGWMGSDRKPLVNYSYKLNITHWAPKPADPLTVTP